MLHRLDGLYAGAEPLASDAEDPHESASHCGGTLSVSTCSTSRSGSDEDDNAGEKGSASSRARVTAAHVRRMIHRALTRGDDVLKKLALLESLHSDGGKCSISGVAKFKSRLTTEMDNLSRALNAIVECDDVAEGVRRRPELAAAYLLARCHGMENYHFIVSVALAEPVVNGLLVTVRPTGPKAARHAMEVDVCSCDGLRWIKTRTGSASSRQADAAEGVEPQYVAQIRELCYRARCTEMPFRHHPEVTVVFRDKPPTSLGAALETHGARVFYGDGTLPPALPQLALEPRFVCLDTTTLVALCSFTCFDSIEDFSAEKRLACLQPYQVLSEQVRKEQVDPAVSGQIDPILARHTSWTTRRRMVLAMQEELRTRLQPPRCDRGISAGESVHGDTCDDLLLFPLSATSADQWIAPLMPSDVTLEDIDASTVVRNVDAERQRRGSQHSEGAANDDDLPITNWIIADITLQEFRWMIETLAGPEEILRAAQILRNVTTVDTAYLRRPRPVHHATTVSPLQRLKTSGRLLARNKVVFGMADAVGALMLSSNRQVVNTAKERGITLMVSLHPSRSLTEQKTKMLRRRSGPSKPPPFDYEESGDDGGKAL